MDEQKAQEILDQLAAKQLPEYTVAKEDFEVFRNVLVRRPDFKHFRGVAKRGGNVLYRYLDEPRS
ncbi:hypothetical protein [Pallidibacillus pasinlerensis]|uniref:Abortive phage infection protein n=1 Tax=Pallidibacillus pasinlerensis TaxID=2703818 RepID=A0ABX0A103_9BACI|nr:hypothetical protein [Pallidibacillus pasinlerensis]NCU17105.1 hypothetical protein [Pallidibacillus pasinlerensis]